MFELHVPPVVEQLNVLVDPEHTVESPLIAATVGRAVTVMDLVFVVVPQPFVTAYEMVTEPAATGVMRPELLTVAIDVLPEDQAPPEVASVSVMLLLVQTDPLPEISATVGTAEFTVISFHECG